MKYFWGHIEALSLEYVDSARTRPDCLSGQAVSRKTPFQSGRKKFYERFFNYDFFGVITRYFPTIPRLKYKLPFLIQ